MLEKMKDELLKKNPLPKVRRNKFLSLKKVDIILSKLLVEKIKLLEKKKIQEKFFMDKSELVDPLDEANMNVQTSQALRFRSRDTLFLKKIEKSIYKITTGEYGLCVECDDKIAYERLLARTTAELCICCKEEAELMEKSSIIGKKSKSFGRSMGEMKQ